jgi:hypothetical protein
MVAIRMRCYFFALDSDTVIFEHFDLLTSVLKFLWIFGSLVEKGSVKICSDSSIFSTTVLYPSVVGIYNVPVEEKHSSLVAPCLVVPNIQLHCFHILHA